MFKINRKIEYALISLNHMNSAPEDKLASAKEICDLYNIPFDPTSRVLQIMAQHGILRAEQGAKGGYKLIKNLTNISLKELSDMIAGPIEIANCFHGNYSHCEINCTCKIIGPMLNLNEHINRMFATIKVSELLRSHHEGEQTIRNKKIMAFNAK